MDSPILQSKQNSRCSSPALSNHSSSSWGSRIVRAPELSYPLLSKKRIAECDTQIDYKMDLIRDGVKQTYVKYFAEKHRLLERGPQHNSNFDEMMGDLRNRERRVVFIRKQMYALNDEIQASRKGVRCFNEEYDILFNLYTKSISLVEDKENEISRLARRNTESELVSKELEQQVNKLQESNSDKDLHLVEANLKIADLEKQLSNSKMQKFISTEHLFCSFSDPNLCKKTITHLISKLLPDPSDEEMRMKRKEYLG
jgi:chromosome segregation ATPase